MPAFVTDGMISELRRFHTAALEHRYTRVPVVAVTDGLGVVVTDGFGDVVVTDGAPVAGLPCMLTFADVVQDSEQGATKTSRPLLWIGHTDTIKPGDRVEHIVDRDGLVLLDAAVVLRWEAGADRGRALTRIVELATVEAVTQPAGGS